MGTRRWVLRVTFAGKRRNRGLGPYPLVPSRRPASQALDIRRAAREGRDLPASERHACQVGHLPPGVLYLLRPEEAEPVQRQTSEAVAFDYGGLRIAARSAIRLVSDITHADVLAILEPIWFEKPETARRVLQRLEAVFKSAILRGQREKASPVHRRRPGTWQRPSRCRAPPCAALRRGAGFIPTLRSCQANPVTKLAFEWLILTATRSGETRGARWGEINSKTGRTIASAYPLAAPRWPNRERSS